MTEENENYKSQATDEQAALAKTTKEEDVKLMETLRSAETFKKVVNITVQAVIEKLSARPMDTANYINLRVTSIQMAAQKASNTENLLRDAAKIYSFLIGDEVKESIIKTLK